MFKGKKLTKKQKIWLLTGGMLLLVVVIACILSRCYYVRNTPTLMVETPPKISMTDHEPIVLDVTISELGDDIYPAASMSIQFDPSRLEFLGIEEGNVFICDRDNDGQRLPDWNCNVKACNDSGNINIMYLDMTGGKYAFQQTLLGREENVVLRLRFRLRGSVKSGDVLGLNVSDAVFAASDETHSLATTQKTLRTIDGKIVVVE